MSEKPDLRVVLEHYGIDVNSMKREVLVRCPVHDEDRASCSVNLEDGLFNCHACSASGDVFTLIAIKEGLDEFGAVVSFAETHFGWSREGVSRPARGRRTGAGLSRGKGYRPNFKRKSAFG